MDTEIADTILSFIPLNKTPLKGDIVKYLPTNEIWTVDHSNDGICYEQKDTINSTKCFIIKPDDNYNNLFEIKVIKWLN